MLCNVRKKFLILLTFIYVQKCRTDQQKMFLAKNENLFPLGDNRLCAKLPLDQMHVLAYQVTNNPFKMSFFMNLDVQKY